MTEFKTQEFPTENRYCLQFETDNRDYLLKVQEAARECIDHKPLTNFERIKAMDDLELVFFIQEICKKTIEEYRKGFYIKCVIDTFGTLAWLRSEVQEDENRTTY